MFYETVLIWNNLIVIPVAYVFNLSTINIHALLFRSGYNTEYGLMYYTMLHNIAFRCVLKTA